jgi:hypothetical protein
MKRIILLAIVAIFSAIAVFGQEPETIIPAYRVPDLNGRAVVLQRPDVPGDVAMKQDGKTLTVRVVVDNNGDVISAKCSTDCPAEVAALAEAAAKGSKFQPLIVDGRAVMYDGTLIYTIAMGKVNWHRFAVALQSVYIFDNLSLGPVAAMLTNGFADEKVKLLALDNENDLEVRWKTINSVKATIRGKLQGADVWWFDLGFAIREVSSPFQSDKKLDLNEVQQAMSNLAKFVDSAPPDLPPTVIENLRALSTFKITPTMTPQEVLQAIIKLGSGIKPEAPVKR